MVKEKRTQEDPGENATRVIVTPPNFKILELHVVGTAPLVINSFSKKARDMMIATQEKGSKRKSRGEAKPAKNFDECYRQARHVAREGWDGVSAAAFKNAMIDACVGAGFFKTRGRVSFFILQDGTDAENGTPLIRIIGEPKRVDHEVTVGMNIRDIRSRPMYDPWAVELRIRYDADVFDESSIANLVYRAGIGGVGEGRPASKKSAGMGWGTFTIENKK